MSRRPASGLPLEHAADPVTGWRANDVVLSPDGRRAWLKGVHRRRCYGPDTTAECAEWDHEAPQEGCHCGLHCWPDRQVAERYRRRWQQTALCRVELSGTVLVHGDDHTGEIEGYRGARMRTLGVEFRPYCSRCGRPATALGVVRTRTGVSATADRRTVQPVCGRCRAEHVMSCAELAGLLGTEVRFGQPGPRREQIAAAAEGVAPWSFPVAATLIFVAALALPLAVLRATLAGDWAVLAGLLLAGLLIVPLGLASLTGLLGPGGWRVTGAITAAVLVAVPLYLGQRVLAAGDGQPPSAAVARAVAGPLPGEPARLERILERAGAGAVATADLDATHRAVRFVHETVCHQLALERRDDGRYAVLAQATFPILTRQDCPLAYPLRAGRGSSPSSAPSSGTPAGGGAPSAPATPSASGPGGGSPSGEG